MSGVDAQRGFIIQSIIAMIECLERNDWDEVKLEPKTKLDKVDIQLYKNHHILAAFQVKSSNNKFSQPKVEEWLKALRDDAPNANEICLSLVGDFYTDKCAEYIKNNCNEIKTISFRNLEELCVGKLTSYIKNAGLSGDVRLSDLEQIDASLFSKIHRNSIKNEPLSRSAFEEAFRNALPIHGLPICLSGYIPVGPEIGIIGRNDILAIVRTMLDSEKNIALVCGVGGIGKTAIMQHICNSIITEAKQDTHVAWITCSENFIDDILTFRQQFGISKELSREEAFDATIRYLQSLQGIVYIFFDDMVRIPDQKELGILNALRPNVRVMITSRHEIKGIPSVKIENLKNEEAIDLFYGYYERDLERKYISDAWIIINSVRNHTLLVELLAKAANASFGPLTDFRQKLENKGFLDVSRRRFDTGRFDNKTIEECVAGLYDISELSKEERYILTLFSIFTPEKVIYGAIEKWAGFDVDSVDRLIKLGWLVRVESGFIIHQIIRDSLAKQIGHNLMIEDYGALLDKVIDMKCYMPLHLGYRTIQERLVLAEDIARYLEVRTEEMLSVKDYSEIEEIKCKKVGALFNNIADVYDNQGDYSKALNYYRKALQIYEKVLGTDHPDTAMVYNNIATVLRTQGDYCKAQYYCKKAIDINERVLGINHSYTATAYNNYAGIFYSQGDYSNALYYYEKAFLIRKQVLVPDDLDIAVSYNNMGFIYYIKGDYQKAREYLKNALAIYERKLGAYHPKISNTYTNLASVYVALGFYSIALDYMEKDRDITEQVFGVNHPTTASSYHNIAVLLNELGDYEKAMEYCRKALDIRERVFGIDHQSTAQSYSAVGDIYKNQKDFNNALKYYKKALDVHDRILDANHPDKAKMYHRIADLYHSKKENEKALKYYIKSLEISEQVLGADHVDTAKTYNNMAYIFRDQGEYVKALYYFEKALDVVKKRLGKEHPYTRDAQLSVQTMRSIIANNP